MGDCVQSRKLEVRCEHRADFPFFNMSEPSPPARSAGRRKKSAKNQLSHAAEQASVRNPRRPQIGTSSSASDPCSDSSLRERNFPPSEAPSEVGDTNNADTMDYYGSAGRLGSFLPSPASILSGETNSIQDPESPSSTKKSPHNGAFGPGYDRTLVPQAPPSQLGTGWPFKNREEARYFMHYVQELATWVDVQPLFRIQHS